MIKMLDHKSLHTFFAQALVDGPCSGVSRQQINFKALQLTSIVMTIPRGLRPGNLAKAWEKQEVQKNWESTTWAKKIANKKKVCFKNVIC